MSESHPVKILLAHGHGHNAAALFEEVTGLGQVSRILFDQVIERVSSAGADVVLFDWSGTDTPDLDLIKRLRFAAPDVPVVVWLPTARRELAAAALQRGAQDYVLAGEADEHLLEHIIQAAIERHRQHRHLHQRAAELVAVELDFQHLIQQNADGIIVVDASGTIRFVNPAAEKLFGRTRHDLVGTQFGFPLVAGETTEIDIVHRANEGKSAEMRVVEIGWEGERCSLASLRDITDRKRAEAALRESQRNYEALVNSIDGIVWEANAQTFQFTFVSRQAERLLGFPAERWLDEPDFWARHVHPDDLDWAFAFCSRATARGEAHEFEYRFIAADGRVVWLRDIVAVITEDGRPVKLRGVMVDITARRKDEEILRRQAQILDQIHDAVVATDLDGVITSWNKGAERLLGYPPEEALSQHISFLYRESDRDFLEHEVIAPLKAQGNHRIEVRMVRKSGQVFHAHLSLSLLHDRQGTITGMIGYAKDITERKQAEDTLRKEQEFTRLILDTDPNLIFVKDTVGRFVLVNQAVAELYETTVEDLQGRSQVDVLSIPREAEFCAQVEHDVLEKMQPVITDETYTRPDGQVFWFNTIRTPLVLPDGTIHILGIAADITDRKQAEEALRESEQRYRLIVETAQEGIWIIDASDRTFFVNGRLAEMFGYSVDEMLGQPFQAFMDDAWRAQEQTHAEHRRRGEKLRHDFMFCRKDGSQFWAIVATTPIFDKRGHYAGALIMVIDITDRKQTEEALRQSERLYRTLASNLPRTGVILFDRDLRFLLAEGDVLGEFGFSSQNLEGRLIQDVLSPEERRALIPHYRAALAGEESHTERIYEGRTFSIQMLPVKNDRGEIFAGLLVAQDVTELKKAARLEAEARAETKRRQQQQREMRSLERFSQVAQATIREQKTATGLLRAKFPEMFTELIELYAGVLDLALEQRAFKIKHDVSEELRDIAERLARLNAGPRDVVEIHLTTLKQKSKIANPMKAQAYAEEGRLVALELMGYLVWLYRNRLQERHRPLDDAGDMDG
jgi:PAS domain S-box-containing protein